MHDPNRDPAEHPATKHPRFVKTSKLQRASKFSPDRYGVKLSREADKAPTWHYGETALEALDAALIYLVDQKLNKEIFK